eukprot:gnl/Ergobibamus_cyprinoides/4835.p1 GENE.gnl/Ergobibamus_cyprinoides/4835~~gnl/Ergobibamus_cyprinoides/4835.p1  ORF type:complete len:157 (+),score=37.88 gnl/Ergobibamus_cyprinoides/4835:208-678(+)
MTDGDVAFPEAIVKVFGDRVFHRRCTYHMGKNLRDNLSRHYRSKKLVAAGLGAWRKLAFWMNDERRVSIDDDPDYALLWGTKCQPIQQWLLPEFAPSWMAEDAPPGIGTVASSQVESFHAALKQVDLGRLSLLEQGRTAEVCSTSRWFRAKGCACL